MTRMAFTLAEVVIVISIIGIIAETTIPELYSNYQKAVTVNQLKKTYSMLNQALQKSIADNGDVSGWDYTARADEKYTIKYWSYYGSAGENYILPYLKVIGRTDCGKAGHKSTNSSDTYAYDYLHGKPSYYLSDGTLITFANLFPGNGY